MIKIQFESQHLKKSLDEELLKKEDLETEIATLRAEKESSAKKVISFLVYLIDLSFKYNCIFSLSFNTWKN
jgi:hypothetical protein